MSDRKDQAPNKRLDWPTALIGIGGALGGALLVGMGPAIWDRLLPKAKPAIELLLQPEGWDVGK